MPRVIDIHSKGDYPANELSNFFPHPFVIDGVECASMEGFLQSLKFISTKTQKAVCALSGKAAKNKGKHKFLWKLTGNIHWNGKKLSRYGEEYQTLLSRAYAALAQNERFIAALTASIGAELCHSIGCRDPKYTILTEQEFIAQLTALRNNLPTV